MKKILLVIFTGLFFAAFSMAQTGISANNREIVPAVHQPRLPVYEIVPVYVDRASCPGEIEAADYTGAGAVDSCLEKLQIIPCLPDPNNGKIYRLQVGSFKMPEAAYGTARLFGSLGFNVTIEPYGSFNRVIITDVPAAMVQFAVQRLAYMGIEQIWIKE